MVKSISGRLHIYAAHDRSTVLAAFLNAAKDKPAGERVQRLAQQCAELQKLSTAVVKSGKHIARVSAVEGLPTTRWCGWTADKRIRPIWEATNRLLRRYKFRRRLPVFLRVASPATLTTVVAETESLRKEPRYGDTLPITESEAVALLLSLLESGALGYLGQCAVCQRWFTGLRVGDKRYCSLLCKRRASYKPRNKKEWREYIKKYRAGRKKRELQQHKIKIGRKGERYA